jgi:small-conductance mechanosensitive channel
VGSDVVGALVGELNSIHEVLTAYPLLAKLVYATILAILVYAILRLYYGILRRLSSARAVEPGVVERLYRFTSLAAWTLTVAIILYIFTGATAAWAAALLIVVVILFANLEPLISFFSYYVLLAERLVRPGDYIQVTGYGEGVVREIRYLYTVLEDRTGVRLIPNRELVRRGFRVVDEVVPARLRVRVHGVKSTEEVEEVRRRIESVAELRGSEVAAIRHPIHGGPGSARAYLVSVGSDYAEYIVEIPVPRPSAGPRRLGVLVYPIALAIREMGYSFEISIENGQVEV